MAFKISGSGGGFVSKGSGGGLKIIVPPPPPFSPLSISGLVGWYDASDVSTLTFETISSLSQVTVWNDKSGQGNHATRNASKSQGVIHSTYGGGGVAFSNQTHSEWFQTNLVPATGAGGRTIITVVSNPGTQAGYIWSYGTPYNPAPMDNIYALVANVPAPITGAGTTKYGIVIEPPGSDPLDRIQSTESSEFQIGRIRKVISTRYNGTTNVIKSGTTTVATTAISLNTGNAQGFRIGNRNVINSGTSSGGGMMIHEILVYNRSLTDEEWNTVIAGTEAKWGAYQFGSLLCPKFGMKINDVSLATITSGPINNTFTFPTDYYNASLVDSNFNYLYQGQSVDPQTYSPVRIGAFAMTLTQAGTYSFNVARPGSGIYKSGTWVYEQTCPDTRTLLGSQFIQDTSSTVNYVYPGGSPKNIIVEGMNVPGLGDWLYLTVTKTA